MPVDYADMQQPIDTRQLHPRMVEIQRAAAAVHVRVNRLEAARLYGALALASAGLVSALVRSFGPGIALVSLGWTLFVASYLSPVTQSAVQRAAKLQEMFDTTLFGLAWNTAIAGEVVSDHEISSLARSLKSKNRVSQILEGWYFSTRRVPYPINVLLCQSENVGWDALLRRRYRGVLMFITTGWMAAGIVVSSLLHLSVQSALLVWFVPSLASISLFVDTLVRQLSVQADRARLRRLISDKVEEIRDSQSSIVEDEVLVFARLVQDGILISRMKNSRVPNAIYAVFRDKDERDFHREAELAALQLVRVISTPQH